MKNSNLFNTRRSKFVVCFFLPQLLLLSLLFLFATSCAPGKKVAVPVYGSGPQDVKPQTRSGQENLPQARPTQPATSPQQLPPIEAPREISPLPAIQQPQTREEQPAFQQPQIREEQLENRQLPPLSGQAGTLLASADKALQAGQPDKAEMQLERALRLSPGEARLWQSMAKVRFEQGNFDQAVQLCLKSNSLAGGNPAIIRGNWLLVEKAYLKMGEEKKAAQARQKAEQLY